MKFWVWSRARIDQGGAISIVVLAVALALLLFGAAGLEVGAVVIAQGSLSQEADETARAAAIALVGGGDACVAAREFLAGASAQLLSCEATDVVTVRLVADSPRGVRKLGVLPVLHATARAGQ